MRALILAAGKGTRLLPLTESKAKPSLPLLGIPMLWFPAWHINRQLQIGAFALNISHAAESVKQAAKDIELHWLTNISFHFSDETGELLGSSGALWKLRQWVGSDLLAVMNGDTLCFPDWKKLVHFHMSKSAAITLHVRSFKNSLSEDYTSIEIDPTTGKVLKLGAKSKSGVMFSGSYLIEPTALKRLPNGFSELRPALLEPLIAEGQVYAFQEELPFLDLGNVHGYVQAQFEVLRLFPFLRELIEVKMREEKPGVWIPAKWRTRNLPALTAPAILSGELEHWEKSSSLFGPKFLGIEPPPAGSKIPFSNALVLGKTLKKL